MEWKGFLLLNDGQSDPRSSQFFLIESTPLKIFGFVFGILAFLKLLFVTQPKKVDIKPAVLILNGFIFGCNFVGLLFAVWLSDFGRLFFQVTPLNPETTDVKEWFTVYGMYIVFWINMVQTLSTMVPFISDPEHFLPPSHILLSCTADLWFQFMVTKFSPGGIMLFFMFINFVCGFMEYGQRTLSSSSLEFQPSKTSQRFIYQMRLVEYIVLFVHAAYFLVKHTCFNARTALFASMIYSAVSFFVHSAIITKLNQRR